MTLAVTSRGKGLRLSTRLKRLKELFRDTGLVVRILVCGNRSCGAGLPATLDALLPMVIKLKGVVGVGGRGLRLSIGTWVTVDCVSSLLSHICCFSSAVVRAVQPFDCWTSMGVGRRRAPARGEGVLGVCGGFLCCIEEATTCCCRLLTFVQAINKSAFTKQEGAYFLVDTSPMPLLSFGRPEAKASHKATGTLRSSPWIRDPAGHSVGVSRSSGAVSCEMIERSP